MNRRLFYKRAAGFLAAASIPFVSSATNQSQTKKRKFPKKLIKPKGLKAGDTIGLIAPSSPFGENRWKNTLINMESLGFKVKYNESRVLAKYGYLAGKDEDRLQDIHDMFADDEVDGIWCVRGGYGSARLLPNLDYDLIKANPKVLIGYSDITALLQGIFLNTGLVCFHGPVGASAFPAYTSHHVVNTIMQKNQSWTIPLSTENQLKQGTDYQSYVLNPGKASGALVGGNLTLITSLMGTPYDIDFTDKIVFLEDIGEKPYRVDRMLTQLLLAGKLQKANGILLGVFNDCDSDADSSLTLKQTLTDRFQGLNMPVAYGFSFGHISNQFTLPLGVQSTMDTAAMTLKLNESCIQ